MTDWLSCDDCGTIYEYDFSNRVSACPFCADPERAIAALTALAPLEPEPLGVA